METGGLQFTWSYDPETQVHDFNGPQRALTAHDVRKLKEAGKALWRYQLNLEGSKYDLPPKQKMLAITFGYLSEAPPGYKFDDTTERLVISKRGSRTVPEVADFQTVSFQTAVSQDADFQTADLKDCQQTALETRNVAAFAACARKDNDNTRLTCQTKYRNQSHDAKNATRPYKRHCFQTRSVYSGPCSGGCKGQCGRGCNGAGTFGGYFQDCLDHDQCAIHHDVPKGARGGSVVCGDEYREARGDFVAGMMGGCRKCTAR
ncbi:MAG: hypothetical protein WA982_06720 [Rubrobacteraceae bacterium]